MLISLNYSLTARHLERGSSLVILELDERGYNTLDLFLVELAARRCVAHLPCRAMR